MYAQLFARVHFHGKQQTKYIIKCDNRITYDIRATMINIKRTWWTVVLFVSVLLANAQKKNDGYALFEDKGVVDSIHMEKLALPDAQVYAYFKDEGDHWGKRVHFDVVDSSKFCMVDSDHVKKLQLLTPGDVIEPGFDLGHDWDSKGNLKDSKATFVRFFIVQKLDADKYIIMQVVPYMGDIFYSSKNRDGL